MKIVLIGFRATGKTTLGRLLAKRLSLAFVDLDEEIERQAQKSIAEIVATEGWSGFREKEKALLREYLGKEGLVLALGGGAVLHEEEIAALRKEALVIWLSAPVKVIAQRLVTDQKTSTSRPSLTGLSPEEEIEKVLSSRLPLYERFAHLRLETKEQPPEALVEEILSHLRVRTGVPPTQK